jgi:CRISPR/Cas system-associated protein endoribonuclease Cas2
MVAFPINKAKQKSCFRNPCWLIIIIYVHPWAKENAKKEGDKVFRFLIGQGKIQHNLLFYFVILKSTKSEARHVYKLQEKMVKREYAKELGEKSGEWYGMML